MSKEEAIQYAQARIPELIEEGNYKRAEQFITALFIIGIKSWKE